jgi:predicted transcriptional regulator
MKRWEEFEKQLLKNPETRREYERLAPRYKVISELIRMRIKKNLTQEQLAKKAGTQQSAVARIESGNINPSIEQIDKLARAMDAEIYIKMC